MLAEAPSRRHRQRIAVADRQTSNRLGPIIVRVRPSAPCLAARRLAAGVRMVGVPTVFDSAHPPVFDEQPR